AAPDRYCVRLHSSRCHSLRCSNAQRAFIALQTAASINGSKKDDIERPLRRSARYGARRGSTLPDALQVRAEVLAELRMTQRVLDSGTQVADLASAVVARAVERPHVDRLVRQQCRDAVRQLDFS